MADEVRLGIIGIGNMGSHHVRSMPQVRRCRLTAVCDVVPAKMDWIDGVAKFTDSRELIRSRQVDAVLVATPHYDHTTIGIDALDNGLHLLTEKPISVHKADCERLIAAHRRNPNLKFAAMFNQRTDPHYQRIRRLVRSGELGEIQRTSWIITDWFRSEAYYASGGWRATWAGEGGGVLLNQCPHNLDLFQWICGVPSKIEGRCSFGKYHRIEVEDEVTAYLEYPNGATGVFVTSTGEAPGTNRLEIVGDRGKLVYESGRILFERTEVSVREFRETTPHAFPVVPTWRCEIPVGGYGGQHLEVLQNFVDAILDGVELIAPAEEGIHSVEMANAMLLSAWTGRAIDLPLDGALYEAELKQRIATSTFVKESVREAVVDMESSF
ncbi:MAG: Gfo/Idh/MocA family oxidoreductase [Fimbriimonadales bacterium]